MDSFAISDEGTSAYTYIHAFEVKKKKARRCRAQKLHAIKEVDGAGSSLKLVLPYVQLGRREFGEGGEKVDIAEGRGWSAGERAGGK